MNRVIRSRGGICVLSSRWPLLLIGYLTAACGGGPGDSGEEAGAGNPDVRPVQNGALDPAATPRWELSETPVWETAGEGAPAASVLAGVSGGAILPDGRVVVTSYASRDVRFYDSEGQLERASRGAPSDSLRLEAPMFVGTFGGDSMMVTDARQGRVFVLDESGEIARSFEPASDTTLALPLVIGVVESGRALVYEGPNYLMAATRTGVRRVPAPVHLAGSDGRIERQLGRFEGGEVSLLIEGQRMTASPVPFTSDFFLAARGDRVAAANSAELAVQIYDGEGNLLHTVRQQRNAVEIPDGEFDRMLTEAVAREQDADARRAAEQRFRQMPRYDTYPAFSSLRFDSEENLWVEDYRARGQTQSRWQVFGPDGALRAYVVVPSGVIVLDISEDAVVGLVRDGSGDRLRLYRLDRGS